VGRHPADYLSLFGWEREQLAAVKKEDELHVQTPKVDDDEAFRLAIASLELEDLANW
jgi:hypothetical protein